MNIININENNNTNNSKEDEELFPKKYEIDLLDTINDKYLFDNLKNSPNNKINNNNKILDNDKNCLTDNYQLNINEIFYNNNHINKNSNIQNYEENLNKIIKEENTNNNENYLDFDSFMKEKKKEYLIKRSFKVPKYFSANKAKNNKIKTQVKKMSNIIVKHKINKNNETIKKEEKKKYSKERIEQNKQRLNKLYNDYKKILNERENKKKELSKEEIKDFSFSPKLNKKSKQITENNKKFTKPIFLRYKKDNSRSDILIKKYELNFTHIPSINKTYNINIYHSNIKQKNNIKERNDKNKKLKNHFFINQNILKRQILLDEYINQQKINNFNNDIIIQKEPKETSTSKSKLLVKKVIDDKGKINKSFIYPTLKNFNFKEKFINNNKEKRYQNISKSKSFCVDYINRINEKTKQKLGKDIVSPIISITQMKKYFDSNMNFFKSNKNKNGNVIKTFIDKINNNINQEKKDDKGISYNIAEKCMNIKRIISKNKMKIMANN